MTDEEFRSRVPWPPLNYVIKLESITDNLWRAKLGMWDLEAEAEGAEVALFRLAVKLRKALGSGTLKLRGIGP